jgi:hypothetical protein
MNMGVLGMLAQDEMVCDTWERREGTGDVVKTEGP